MSNEKQRIANEVFTQPGIPYSRLKKEFLKADYPIELKDPLHWIMSKTIDGVPIVLDVRISKKYPFEVPQVIVLSPKPFVFQGKSIWGPSKTLDDLFPHVLESLRAYTPPEGIPTPPVIQRTIDLVKQTSAPVHLVLGSHPGEDPVGRTIYTNPQIFLLDRAVGEGDIRRFFNIDFTNLQQMNWLCSQLPGAFETIILDTSTMKFFTPHPGQPQDQLKFLEILSCLYRLLTPTGTLFLADPGMSYGGVTMMIKTVNAEGKIVYVPDTSPQAGSIMKEMLESVGFQAVSKDTEEITHPLVQLVHKDRTDRMGSRYFLVATKPKKGGKRKTRGRKLKRRKHTKRR